MTADAFLKEYASTTSGASNLLNIIDSGAGTWEWARNSCNRDPLLDAAMAIDKYLQENLFAQSFFTQKLKDVQDTFGSGFNHKYESMKLALRPKLKELRKQTQTLILIQTARKRAAELK